LSEELVAKLKKIVGQDNVLTDETARRIFSDDIFYEGATPSIIIQPHKTEMVPQTIKLLINDGISILPRGGGLSYSAGYISDNNNSAVIDTRCLNKILEINKSDMYVTVESGITWLTLNNELAKKGLRTPFWGTGSGKYATVGATLSQNALNYGSGQYGFAAQSVIGIDIVTADGSVIKTGSSGDKKNTPPFLRHYGPDLTGLFIGDCGALGIKTIATLQLIERQKKTLYGAYEFNNVESFCNALSALTRSQIVSECFGFDPNFTRLRTTYSGIADGLNMLKDVAKSQDNFSQGIKEAINILKTGDKYLKEIKYSIHFALDARDDGDAFSRLQGAEQILNKYGKQIEASVPKIMRSNPFPDPTMLLGHKGERWVPVHGIVPHSKFKSTLKAIHNFMNQKEDKLKLHSIDWAVTSIPAGGSAVLIEPNLYWKDSRPEMIKDYLSKKYLNKSPKYETNYETRKYVSLLRDELISTFLNQGAVHMQIGRKYPYLRSRKPEIFSLLTALKSHLDPKGLMNPGVLGL